jgi:drug/metabolite transporter (DMT)-like permease
MVLMLGSAGAWAIYAVVGRRSVDADATEVTAGALLIGSIALLPFVAYERPTAQVVSMGAGDLLALAVLGSLVTAGSYLCFAFGIQRLQANEASVLCSVEPVFGLVFAWLLLGEGLSVQKLIGAAVIVASCVLVAIGESGADPEIQTQSSTMVTV